MFVVPPPAARSAPLRVVSEAGTSTARSERFSAMTIISVNSVSVGNVGGSADSECALCPSSVRASNELSMIAGNTGVKVRPASPILVGVFKLSLHALATRTIPAPMGEDRFTSPIPSTQIPQQTYISYLYMKCYWSSPRTPSTIGSRTRMQALIGPMYQLQSSITRIPERRPSICYLMQFDAGTNTVSNPIDVRLCAEVAHAQGGGKVPFRRSFHWPLTLSAYIMQSRYD
jgi:hypothetical protein